MVERNSRPVEPWRTPLVVLSSVGLVGPSQFGRSQPEPRSKKPAASVPSPSGMRYSAFAAVTRFAPAGEGGNVVAPEAAGFSVIASGPNSPVRRPRTNSSPEKKREENRQLP